MMSWKPAPVIVSPPSPPKIVAAPVPSGLGLWMIVFEPGLEPTPSPYTVYAPGPLKTIVLLPSPPLSTLGVADVFWPSAWMLSAPELPVMNTGTMTEESMLIDSAQVEVVQPDQSAVTLFTSLNVFVRPKAVTWIVASVAVPPICLIW